MRNGLTPRAELLDHPEPEEHFLQLYGKDDRLLTENVSRYLSEGLKRGDGLLVIATAEHRGSLVRKLRDEGGYSKAVLEGRLVFLDAAATLNRFMVDGAPDQARFEAVIGEALQGVRSRAVHTGIRAYGEMVGVLWLAGQCQAAVWLEQLWNELLQSSDVSLFCAYPIDVLSPEFHHHAVDALLCAHTHVVPTNAALEAALNRAMEEVLGDRVKALRPLIQSNHRPAWAEVPKPEAMILWLRNNLPGSVEQILRRTREFCQPLAS
ncbi:MAG: MEDS domain-containing protein [Gemmatimonadales bacterium]